MRAMRCETAFVVALTLLTLAGPVEAELETVVVGGEVRIRGNYWRNSFCPGMTPGFVAPEVRWPARWLIGRPIGDARGGQNVTSLGLGRARPGL